MATFGFVLNILLTRDRATHPEKGQNLMKKLKLLALNINLFEGGGESGGTAPVAGEQMGEAPSGDTGDASQPDRNQTFHDLINGEYKDLYDAEVQKIVKNRVKDMGNLKKQLGDQQAIIDRMNAKYGTTDLQALSDAIDHDEALWEEAADKAGMTTEQYIQFQNLERQNRQLLQAEKERVEEEQKQQRAQMWREQAVATKEKFPEFDLQKEINNPDFVRLASSGVPLEHAYKVVHFDELQNRTAQTVASQTENAVTANIKAKGSRPAENGLNSQSSYQVHTDVKQLTRQDRADIAKRASRGEYITF